MNEPDTLRISILTNGFIADISSRHFRFRKFPVLLMALHIVLMSCKSATYDEVGSYITEKGVKGSFPISVDGASSPLYVSREDYPGVAIIAGHLQADIGMVTGVEPEILTDDQPGSNNIVVIGTIGKSPLIDRLVESKKLDVSEITGKWETFIIQPMDDPFPGVDQALVIAGSDMRGTIYGMFDLASQMGVSPWYWWADVPVPQKKALYVLPGRYSDGEPAVRYRGIFINDEAPALSGWVYENFGGFNHEFYEHVFELILRLKGNFLWPAMWGRAFYADDPVNPELADQYGIVIGTSHHEPMMRAHDEWRRFGSGAWNYEKNEKKLRDFWREGVERMGSYESLVTIGMRGDGDEPMTEGTAIELLERIVSDQRGILESVCGKPAAEVPQVWALYKEVQEYYDHGMRVPDDVTLLLCDDNWGNIRKLPGLDEINRPGGYGIYYHFDYVGGPRNYKWLNTTQIERVWEQMHLAYNYGVDRIWIVNVGDIKPMEFPIQFFLDYAWDPQRWPAERLPEYYQLWAGQQFGSVHADGIADIISRYTKFNSRRKPELLSPGTYSQVNYQEAERIISDYNELVAEAENIYAALPDNYKAAFFQLVLYPVKACANLNELYVTVGRNHLYADQKRSLTNELADRAKELYENDATLTAYFHTELSGGRWNHMMSQTHIGYTYWQQPEHQSMPEIKTIDLPSEADMGVAVEGSEIAEIGVFDPFYDQSYYIDIFNKGMTPFNYTIEPGENYIEVSSDKGQVKHEVRIWVSVNWDRATSGALTVPITITGPGESSVVVQAKIDNSLKDNEESVKGFIESNGFISIEATHYSKAVENESISWLVIPNLGRTLSAVTPVPVTSKPLQPVKESPHLEYQVYLNTTGTVKVHAYLSPTLNFHNSDGLKYGVSFDDGPIKINNMHERSDLRTWEYWVSNNINIQVSEHQIMEPGNHVLNYYMVDPGIVLQKLIIETGPVKESYLGPPESKCIKSDLK